MLTHSWQIRLTLQYINHSMEHIGRLLKLTHVTGVKGGLDWSAFIHSFAVRIPLAIISCYLTSNLVPHLNLTNPVGEIEIISANLPLTWTFSELLFDSNIIVIYLEVCRWRKQELWYFLLVQTVWHSHNNFCLKCCCQCFGFVYWM